MRLLASGPGEPVVRVPSARNQNAKYVQSFEVWFHQGRGIDMTDKSPRKAASKKPGKTLKEKRQAKKEKGQTRKG
ncbi:MAG: hypothetical protein ACYCV7_07990 [Acidimicrobiales bacterium]